MERLHAALERLAAKLFDGNAPEDDQAAAHRRRFERLTGVARPDELRELERLHYRSPPRDAEQLAADEAALRELEARYEPTFVERVRSRREARVRALRLPVTTDDEQALIFDTLEPTRAVQAVRRWYATEAPLLVLSGPPGRGKTLAAAHTIVRHGGRYVRALDLGRLYLAQFGAEVVERSELARAQGVLVCDDLGTEHNPDAVGTALSELLDARRRGQRSIWATNLDQRAFGERYPDARLHSRMAQSAHWLIDAGGDLRRATP